MDQLENELREVLGRKTPPPGFVCRTRARLPREASFPAAPALRFGTRWGGVLAAAVILALGAAFFQHERHVRDRNRVALQQTLTALCVAAKHLDRAERRAFSSSLWERPGREVTEATGGGGT